MGLLNSNSLNEWAMAIPDRARGIYAGLLDAPRQIGQMFDPKFQQGLLSNVPKDFDKQKAMALAMDVMPNPMTMAGTIVKNPLPFKVAHGTSYDFDVFNKTAGRTADHIYTVPLELSDDAAKYGNKVLQFEAKPRKMIDFSNYDVLDKSTIAKLKKAAKDAGITDKYYPFDDFFDSLMSGQLYQSGGGPSAQNAFLNELFGNGFDAVKMPDAGFGGAMSTSYVFENPELLKRIK